MTDTELTAAIGNGEAFKPDAALIARVAKLDGATYTAFLVTMAAEQGLDMPHTGQTLKFDVSGVPGQAKLWRAPDGRLIGLRPVVKVAAADAMRVLDALEAKAATVAV